MYFVFYIVDTNGASSNNHGIVINGDLSDNNKVSNGNRDMQDDEEEEDDDDLFCDSLGPELLAEQVGCNYLSLLSAPNCLLHYFNIVLKIKNDTEHCGYCFICYRLAKKGCPIQECWSLFQRI